MAIFQPSNVIPDMRSGLGLGVVDATEDMTVSWRVRGQSALTAFSITIYQNDSASTQIYATRRITDGCPAYGVTSTGEIQFFSYTIPASALTAAGISNGNEYKLVIQQWWSASESVTQTSASAFYTRARPVLSISAIGTGGVIDTRFYTFTGTYSQAQGDVLNWFRWRIAYAADTDDPFFDSGNISGTMEISAYYDGFFTGSAYAVRLTAQTENGVEADTGWVEFSASYDVISLENGVTAACAAGTDAAQVTWAGMNYIPGVNSGGYTLTDGTLSLPAHSPVAYVKWETENSGHLEIEAPWTVLARGRAAVTIPSNVANYLFRGVVNYETSIYVSLQKPVNDIYIFYALTSETPIQGDGRTWFRIPAPRLSSGEAYFQPPAGTYSLDGAKVRLQYMTGTRPPYTVSMVQGHIIINNTAYTMRSSPPSGAAAVDTDAVAGTEYPTVLARVNHGGDTVSTVGPCAPRSADLTFEFAFAISSDGSYGFTTDYWPNAIVGEQALGPLTDIQICGGLDGAEYDYVEVTANTDTATLVNQAIRDSYQPNADGMDVFFADFRSDLNAGNLSSGGTAISGYAVYRRENQGQVLLRVADTAADRRTLFDYGAVNGSEYEYYVFPIGEDAYLSTPLQGGAITPCWWSWTLMECAETADNNIFSVLAAYRFRYNLESGAMSNNNTPGVFQNFTPYPTVQLAPQNYRSGTLTGLIGAVEYTDGQPHYRDTIALRDAIYALSLTKNALFLKNRKGDLIRIRVSGPVTMTTDDKTREQTQTMALPWVESGSADGVSLWASENAGVSP